MTPAGIGGYQLATLHAFNIDEPQPVAGVDWYGDSRRRQAQCSALRRERA